MVVQFEAGDLFLTDAQTIAHGCNCAGRMGKGIAEEIKSRFPEMFLEYRRRCEVGSFKPGTAYLEKSTAPWVLNLATQDTARGAQLSYVVVCLQWIADHFESVGMTSLSMPRIGAGLGGLRWVDVRRTIIEILDPIDLPVVVYEEFLSGVKAPESILAPVGSESREPEDSPVLFGRHHANFRELSNFFPSTISIDGKEYPTVEHYYQASKAMDAAHHEIIRSAASPKKARKLGREILAIWPDWEARKIDVMRRALRAKFSQHHQLRDVLLSTGGRPIREDSPQDAEWGWQNGEGRDLLGKLLMEVRAELKSGMREQQTRTIVEEDCCQSTDRLAGPRPASNRHGKDSVLVFEIVIRVIFLIIVRDTAFWIRDGFDVPDHDPVLDEPHPAKYLLLPFIPTDDLFCRLEIQRGHDNLVVFLKHEIAQEHLEVTARLEPISYRFICIIRVSVVLQILVEHANELRVLLGKIIQMANGAQDFKPMIVAQWKPLDVLETEKRVVCPRLPDLLA